jgi:hypothetical protein
LPISALLARIRKLIPKHNDRHYDEIAPEYEARIAELEPQPSAASRILRKGEP